MIEDNQETQRVTAIQSLDAWKIKTQRMQAVKPSGVELPQISLSQKQMQTVIDHLTHIYLSLDIINQILSGGKTRE